MCKGIIYISNISNHMPVVIHANCTHCVCQEFKWRELEEQRQAERLQRQLQQEQAYLLSLQQAKNLQQQPQAQPPTADKNKKPIQPPTAEKNRKPTHPPTSAQRSKIPQQQQQPVPEKSRKAPIEQSLEKIKNQPLTNQEKSRIPQLQQSAVERTKTPPLPQPSTQDRSRIPQPQQSVEEKKQIPQPQQVPTEKSPLTHQDPTRRSSIQEAVLPAQGQDSQTIPSESQSSTPVSEPIREVKP